MKRLVVLITTAMLVAGSAGVAQAQPPASVPPAGSTCGAFYGLVVADNALGRLLSGDVNPGILHEGFAGAEAFPYFSCP